MENLHQRLDQIVDKISQEDFLQNKGLSNEVGFYVFCYEPKDEMVVRHFVKQLAADKSHGFRVIEKDLYEVLLEICQDKKVLSGVANLEAKKGRDHQYLIPLLLVEVDRLRDYSFHNIFCMQAN